jgi:hypothetical protein
MHEIFRNRQNMLLTWIEENAFSKTLPGYYIDSSPTFISYNGTAKPFTFFSFGHTAGNEQKT